MMLNCDRATLLISESQERELSRWERTKLGLHTAMCSGCRNFEHQIPTLRTAARRFAALPSTSPIGTDDASGSEPPV